MIKSRGYPTATSATLESPFYHKPTPLQLASYGVVVVNLIRNEDVEGLEEVMEAGLSPNASNSYGESIVHQICRRCSVLMLDVLLRANCEVISSDDHGRTPLHYACWAPEPNFPLVERLLETDMQLLHMVDSRGHTPLSYTRQEHWSEWLQFLNAKKEVYWPRRSKEEAAAALNLHSALNAAPTRSPSTENQITIEMAKMVAEGKLTPKEAIYLRSQDEESSSDDSDDDSDDDDSDEDDDSESYDDDDDDDDSASEEQEDDETSEETPTAEENPACSEYDLEASWDLTEMKNVLDSLNKPNRRPLAW
jgi:hypothetical protein